MHQLITPSLSQTIWPRCASRQFLTIPIVQTLLPVTFGYSLSSEAVVMRQLRRWKRLWRRSLTRSHKRTSMGLPDVLGTVQQVDCSRGRLLRKELEFYVRTINKSAHTKKFWKLINDPRIYLVLFIQCLHNELDVTEGQFVKRNKAALNSVFLLLHRLFNQNNQFALLFTLSWMKSRWIHTFPKGIIENWIVNNHVEYWNSSR